MELLILDIKGISKVSTFIAMWTSVLTSHTGIGELICIELKNPKCPDQMNTIYKDVDVKISGPL